MGKYIKSVLILNKRRIKEIARAAEISLEQTAEATRTELISKGYMPFDNGTLQNESTFVDKSELDNGKISIVSATVYARRLYFHPEYDFQFINNNNARAYWLHEFLPGGEDEKFINNAFKRLFKKNGGF